MAAPVYDESSARFLDDGSDYGDEYDLMPPSPGRECKTPSIIVGRHSLEASMPEEPSFGGPDPPVLGSDPTRVSMGFLPLPPEDPTDNPEQRANRIRSFYKEYFDESKPAPVRQPSYQEDYGQEYLGNGTGYVPAPLSYPIPQAPFA